jgi:hypothetical protein
VDFAGTAQRLRKTEVDKGSTNKTRLHPSKEDIIKHPQPSPKGASDDSDGHRPSTPKPVNTSIHIDTTTLKKFSTTEKPAGKMLR